MKSVDVANANYIDGYKVQIEFMDKTTQTVDFWPFLEKNSHPLFDQYRNIDQFKQFKIDPDAGNIVWGDNWDLIFPIDQLYKGKIKD
jgi:hypothetical protein